MYKVFFNDRTVFFGDDFSRAFLKHKGLFYKYNSFMELNELVGLFDSLNKINNLYILHENILDVFEEFKACFKVRTKNHSRNSDIIIEGASNIAVR